MSQDVDVADARGEEAETWARALGPEKRAVIRRLHQIQPLWNLAALAFIAIWVVAGFVVLRWPYLWLRLVGYVVIGAAIQGLAILMHEGVHGNLFRRRWLDRWVGFYMGAPSLFSVTAYRVSHTLHHRLNRTEGDPNEITNVSENPRILALTFYAWLCVGMIPYLVHVPLSALRNGRPDGRRAVVIEHALLGGLYACVFWLAVRFGFVDAIVHCWLLPAIVAGLFGNVRGWAEHTMTVRGHPLTQTRTVTSKAIVSFFMCNLNYHLEHHLHPGMPWYNLRKLHALLEDDYRRAASFVYRSYLAFLWDALRTGVHGLAPSARGT